MFDKVFSSMLRGFGWGVGRRAAGSLSPALVWAMIAVFVVLYLMGVRF
jgi:hypothetical protein